MYCDARWACHAYICRFSRIPFFAECKYLLSNTQSHNLHIPYPYFSSSCNFWLMSEHLLYMYLFYFYDVKLFLQYFTWKFCVYYVHRLWFFILHRLLIAYHRVDCRYFRILWYMIGLLNTFIQIGILSTILQERRSSRCNLLVLFENHETTFSQPLNVDFDTIHKKYWYELMKRKRKEIMAACHLIMIKKS
jgi:hypothetical protein